MSTLSTPAVISRLCACNCGRRFTPPINRPNRQYIYGHRAHPRGSGLHPPRETKPEVNRVALDFKFAIATAKKQAEVMESVIEALDDEMEKLRGKIAEAQAGKDLAVEKHWQLMKAIEGLEPLVV